MKLIVSVFSLLFVLQSVKLLPVFVTEEQSMASNNLKLTGCGQTKYDDTHHRMRREIGGSETLPNEFPWQVSICDAEGVHFCGGSILDPTHILTAAHCTTELVAGNTTILAGKHKLYSLEESEQRVNVTGVVPHEHYLDVSSGNDLAVITLASPLKFNDDVQPICLAEEDDLSLKNLTTISTGWGEVIEHIWDHNYPAKVLQKVNLTLLDNSACKNAYPDDYMSSVDERLLCAGGVTESRGTCHGDSGGPLVIKQAGHWLQIGIVSWGSGIYCGNPSYPDVFTKVAYFKGWIERQLQI